jgi:NAD+ synthase (glutamine-hydrolysing)
VWKDLKAICKEWSQLAQCADLEALIALNERTASIFQSGFQGEGLMASLQWNPIAGDVKGNTEMVALAMHFANAIGVDVLVLPEQTLLGYPLRDMLLRFPKLVKDNEKAVWDLAQISTHTKVLVGFAERRYDLVEGWGEAWGKPYYNSVAILGNGQIEGVVRKRLLPNYHEFEDSRVFEVFDASNTLGEQGVQHADRFFLEPAQHLNGIDEFGNITLHGVKYAITICEDLWAKEPNQHPWYKKSVVDSLMRGKPDVLVNLSSSPSRSGKEFRRNGVLQDVAKRYQTPILYVNQVGAVDELIFDGGSRLINAKGDTLSRSPLFEVAFQVHHLNEPELHERAVWCHGVDLSHRTSPEDVFDPYDERDLPRTYEALCCGIRDYFKKCGFKRAVLGLSGGLDSAVNAVLVADALGAENVFAFAFPSQLTPSLNQAEAEQLARNLGIGWAEIPINTMQSSFLDGIEQNRLPLETRWGKPSPYSFAQDNVQAISRATLLRLLGNDYNALPIATSDKSEFYMGYTTVNGDMSGALAPLGDVCKCKVRALARWMNTHRTIKTIKTIQNVIPQGVVERPSGADLAMNPETGKLLTAEEALMPYEVIDEIIWRIEAHAFDSQALLRHTWSWEHQHGTLDTAQKQEWIQKFFRRMQASVFKWWVAPPILIVDGDGTLAKSAYHHTITANRTVY